jgi:hypothetical protein
MDETAKSRRRRKRNEGLEYLVAFSSGIFITFCSIGAVKGYTQEEVTRAGVDLNCGLGFAGLQCGEVITCEANNYCHGHGICKRGGACVCDPGWKGSSCNEAYCPSDCSGHGTCMSDGRGCLCDSGFSGTICNKVSCLGGGNCTGHGACLEGGICQCDKGYLGGGCDQVNVALKCSNHGTISQSIPSFLASLPLVLDTCFKHITHIHTYTHTHTHTRPRASIPEILTLMTLQARLMPVEIVYARFGILGRIAPWSCV